jgi:type 1 glutamine amidotransferase
MKALPALPAALVAAAVLASTVACHPAGGETAMAAPPLRVLMITGGGWHDYASQQEILARGLGERTGAEFTIDFEAGERSNARISRHEDEDWVRGFDVVLYNMCFAEVDEPGWVDRIVRAHVTHRVPAVALHCAAHSYNYSGDNPIWSMFLGVRSHRHQRHMPFTVEALAPEHPILANIPLPWTTPEGELYEIVEVYPTATPLAHAYGEDSGEHHATVWTNRFAGVRVFGTTIGHHNETMAAGTYLDLVAAGLLWAAGRLEPDDGLAGDHGVRPGSGVESEWADVPGSEAASRRRVVFVAGERSHGYGAHEHHAGSLLLARLLEEHHPGIESNVHRDGWPADPATFADADAIVIYANGGTHHPALPHLDALGRLMDRGVGLVVLHYAVEVPADQGGRELLDWVGGYFETDWSVNPFWDMESMPFPDHPIARGLAAYSINDEWYYHMRFREGMAGVQPILTALPPASSLERPDGPHSGNPHVRAAVLERGEPQQLAWATERADGGRGFGFTGAHWHWNWGHPMQRRLVLNAIAWAAHAEVPHGGVGVGVVTMEDLESNQDYDPPADFDRDRWRRLVERWHREVDGR